jgi:hypothetical protein
MSGGSRLVVLLTTVCLCAEVAAPALALVPPPQQETPATGAVKRRDAPLTISAADPSEPSELYVTVSSSQSVDANGALDGIQSESFILGGPLFSFTLHYVDETYFLSVPGTYYWQVERFDCDYPDCRALSPVRSFEIREPITHSEPIPASAGRQVGTSRPHSFLLYPGRRPPQVSLDRLQAIAARGAGRWGIAFRGQTAATPGTSDGIQSVGFSGDDLRGALARTIISKRRVYRPGIVHCKRIHGHRVCHRGPPRGTWKVVEEDIKIDPNWAWAPGPRYPTNSEFDLESTLLHEFGHFAGNGHVHGCINSPMVDLLAPGDWWRAADDWNRYGCTGATPAARAAGISPAPLDVVVRYLPPTRRPARP